MRHFFGYDADGRLRSIETYGPRGWPICDCDACESSELNGMLNSACVAPRCVSLRESRDRGPVDYEGFILYDCPCDAAVDLLRDCTCISDFGGTHYVDVSAQTFVPKPSLTVKLDDETIVDRQVVSREPGAVAVLKLLVPGIPDGTVALLFQKGQIDIYPDDDISVTFSGGESTTLNLVAPAPGTKGTLVIDTGKYIRGISFQLRGFATA
jgi:hypothetical protein